MNTPDSEMNDMPDDFPDDIPGETVPSDATVRSDRADAMRGHEPDREPTEDTEDEDDAAERGAAQTPDVSEPYEETLGRGADITREGQILPD